MLALGETTVPNLKRRIDLRAVRDAETALRDVLAEVAESGPTKGIYKLRDALACEVTDCYAEYTEMERAKVREWRDAALKSARGKTDDPMTVEQIDGAVDAFERTYKKNVGKIGTEREEGEMRKSFQRLFPLYSAIIARLEHLQKMFITLEKRYREARSKGDMDTWAKKIARTHARFKNQRAKLERVLPLLHSNLKQMRSVLWEFASCQVN